MTQELFIAAIVIGAAAFLLRRWLRVRKGSGGCCGCGSDCSSTGSSNCTSESGTTDN